MKKFSATSNPTKVASTSSAAAQSTDSSTIQGCPPAKKKASAWDIIGVDSVFEAAGGEQFETEDQELQRYLAVDSLPLDAKPLT